MKAVVYRRRCSGDDEGRRHHTCLLALSSSLSFGVSQLFTFSFPQAYAFPLQFTFALSLI
jgi:hypothetical protein